MALIKLVESVPGCCERNGHGVWGNRDIVAIIVVGNVESNKGVDYSCC